MKNFFDRSEPQRRRVLDAALTVNYIYDLPSRFVLNGQTMQDSNTDLFAVPELIEFLSQAMTLEPGDLIATVGFARKPGVFLKPDDLMEGLKVSDL